MSGSILGAEERKQSQREAVQRYRDRLRAADPEAFLAKNNETAASWRDANPDKVALNNAKKRAKQYGLTVEQMFALFERSENACEICGCDVSGKDDRGKHKAQIDHAHNTGRVRGVLCHHHNTALGGFGDDPALLRAAANYVERGAGELDYVWD